MQMGDKVAEAPPSSLDPDEGVFRALVPRPSMFPGNSEQWYGALAMTLGALLSWFAHPLVWPVSWFSPFYWVAMIWTTAAQESGFDPQATGDEGRSVGILQFHDANEGIIYKTDNRRSPFWSGYLSAKYVQKAIIHDWRWLAIASPVIGMAWFRWLWTSGPSSEALVAGWTGNDTGETAWSRFRSEGIAFGAWWTYNVIGLLLSAGTVAGVYAWFTRDTKKKKPAKKGPRARGRRR